MPNKTISDDLIIKRLEAMTAKEFLELGSDGLAYIKPLNNVNNTPLYAVYSADGSHIATGQDIAALKTIAAQNNFSPMTTH